MGDGRHTMGAADGFATTPRQFTFLSDNDGPPNGQYLVTIWPTGHAELAWRPTATNSTIWSRPSLSDDGPP